MKIKVCGMKYEENIRELEALHPDYMGFLFYEGSKRYVETDELPKVSESIDKIGVFVNEDTTEVLGRVRSDGLAGVQLHGEESPAYIEKLRAQMKGSDVKIIKAFPVGNSVDWESMKSYEPFCDYFLFDTRGKDRGGNGVQFNWNLLSGYPLKTEYFLSGGIGPQDIEPLKEFFSSTRAELCHSIDVNSQFELNPGMKDIEKLRTFIKDFKAIRS
jgi:phosphoribosylanthranilate isomerase